MNNQNLVLPVKETLQQAWINTRGVKATYWKALVITTLIMIAIKIVEVTIQFFYPPSKNIFSLLDTILSILFQAGLIYIGICRAFGLPTHFSQVFYPFKFNIGFRLVLIYLIKIFILLPFSILAVIGIVIIFWPQIPNTVFFYAYFSGVLLLLLAIWGIIYFALRLSTTSGFVLKNDFDFIPAIKASWQVTRKNVLALFSIYLIYLFWIIISLIPLGIGLIWTLPWGVVLFGEAYKKLQGNLSNIIPEGNNIAAHRVGEVTKKTQN